MIKLCGIRRREDISYINEFKPDFMGMILSDGFKRTIQPETAGEILKELDRNVRRIGVFVNESEERVSAEAKRLSLDGVQLHGNEDALYIQRLRNALPARVMIWKAVRVKCREDIETADNYGCDFLLLDSFVQGKVGGTGVAADWDIIRNTPLKTPFFLAGGIGENNLASALEVSGNVDLSGSAETNGVKDREKIKRIMEIYRERTG